MYDENLCRVNIVKSIVIQFFVHFPIGSGDYTDIL